MWRLPFCALPAPFPRILRRMNPAPHRDSTWKTDRSHEPGARALTDRGEVPFSAQNVLDRALLPDRKHDDRNPVFLGKRATRGVHDLQPPVQPLLMVEA